MNHANFDISQDVLFGIAQLALDKVEGISPNTPPVRIGEVLTGRRAKGISVELEDKVAKLYLTVRVDYGLVVPEVAKKAQKVIREAISSMTGLEVQTVNVTVEAIDVPEGHVLGG